MKFTRLLFLFFICYLSTFLTAQENLRGLLAKEKVNLSEIYGNRWALIVGINDYRHFPILNAGVEDAEGIKRVLETQFSFPEENIIMLLDNKATKDAIQNGFYSLIERSKPEDCVIIFFAGHGETKSLEGEASRDLGYLIPVNGDPDNIERSSISMDRISTLSDQLPAKSVLFLVDACYGGLAATGITRSGEDVLDYVKQITVDRARQIITAGKAGEKVVENLSDWGHSAFTKAIIEGLMDLKADADTDGIIPAFELFAYLKKRVITMTKGMQTPVFSKFGQTEGEFVFLDEKILSLGSLDLSGFGFLTIPDEPFGALIRINDKLIGKKTPLIKEQLKAGYHTVTVSKDGYQDDSERIFIDPDKTKIFRPELKLIEGILNLASLPQRSLIKLDGKLLEGSSLKNILVPRGKHKIELSIPGYEKIAPFEVNIDSIRIYNLPLPSFVPKTKMKAFARSMLIPGWGQYYYEKPKRSIVYSLAAVITAGYYASRHLKYESLKEDYDAAMADYNIAIDATLIEERRNRVNSLYEDLKDNRGVANLALYSLGGVYTVNLLDIVLTGSWSNRYGYSNELEETRLGLKVSDGQITFELRTEF